MENTATFVNVTLREHWMDCSKFLSTLAVMQEATPLPAEKILP